MQDEIVLESGVRIAIHGRPAQGTRHGVLFGAVRETGEAVVVKLEGVAGALERERAALEYLAGSTLGVPRLKAAGLTHVSGRQVVCLVMIRQDGQTPTSRNGWQRLGQALGRLAEPASEIGPLPVIDARRFGDEHAQRVYELGGRLDPIAAAVPDWPSLTSCEMPRPGPLVLTHGDPGPGNFLDDGRDGWLIDWEDAHVAPRGLDLARVAFIAWLGSGPAGYAGRDHDARAHAAVAGYLKTVPGGWRPSVEEQRWWLAVAGVQFIHRRWQRDGRPAPWEAAADVLHRGLTSSTAWE